MDGVIDFTRDDCNFLPSHNQAPQFGHFAPSATTADLDVICLQGPNQMGNYQQNLYGDEHHQFNSSYFGGGEEFANSSAFERQSAAAEEDQQQSFRGHQMDYSLDSYEDGPQFKPFSSSAAAAPLAIEENSSFVAAEQLPAHNLMPPPPPMAATNRGQADGGYVSLQRALDIINGNEPKPVTFIRGGLKMAGELKIVDQQEEGADLVQLTNTEDPKSGSLAFVSGGLMGEHAHRRQMDGLENSFDDNSNIPCSSNSFQQQPNVAGGTNAAGDEVGQDWVEKSEKKNFILNVMKRWGYEEGKGLGKFSQGMLQPVNTNGSANKGAIGYEEQQSDGAGKKSKKNKKRKKGPMKAKHANKANEGNPNLMPIGRPKPVERNQTQGKWEIVQQQNQFDSYGDLINNIGARPMESGSNSKKEPRVRNYRRQIKYKYPTYQGPRRGREQVNHHRWNVNQLDLEVRAREHISESTSGFGTNGNYYFN